VLRSNVSGRSLNIAISQFVLSNTAKRSFRAVIALVLVIWLASSVGLEAIVQEFARVQISLVLLATVLLALDGLSKVRNWQLLLGANVDEHPVPFRSVLVWFFAGGFIGAIVPSSAGTDACRVVLAARALVGQTAACAASIFTLNALGWFTGCIIGLVGLGILSASGTLPVLLEPVGFAFMVTLALLPMVYGTLAAKRTSVTIGIERIGLRWPRVGHTLTKFLGALLVFEHAHVRFPLFLLVAAFGLLAQTGMFAVTAHALGIDLPFGVWMVLVPLTRIVALVPVSIADFGLIQAAHVSVLSLFGVPPWQSFTLSTLFAMEGLLIHSTLGTTAFLAGGRGRAVMHARPRALTTAHRSVGPR
jgi:Lysylphosphatidylglycerol synthase TM region